MRTWKESKPISMRHDRHRNLTSLKKILKGSYNFFKRQWRILGIRLRTPKVDRLNKSITIFNHIPKCGGTSFTNILSRCFDVVRDYPPHDAKFKDPVELKDRMADYIKHPVELSGLKPWQLLAGHYHDSPFHINERYPKISGNNNVRLITFLRDPLEHRLSMYYYAKKRNHNYSWIRGKTLEDFMKGPYMQNYFARALECNEGNYEQILSNYFFIGILEDYENSIRKLSFKLHRPIKGGAHLNQTIREASDWKVNFSLEEFRKLNELDYKIYNFAKGLHAKG